MARRYRVTNPQTVDAICQLVGLNPEELSEVTIKITRSKMIEVSAQYVVLNYLQDEPF
jgi:hypothetical protein